MYSYVDELIFFCMSKRIKKFALLPDTSDNVYHVLLKYPLLGDVIKVRFKYTVSNQSIDIKAITGAVKNPSLCAVIDTSKLAHELNEILNKKALFDIRLSKELIENKLIDQGLIYPF